MSVPTGQDSSRITVARGDGIGPEIMDATLRILEAAGARLDMDEIVIGEQRYHSGHSAGMDPADWDVIRRNKVLFKAPITTPQGGGVKSLNVTLRKSLGLYANLRPVQALHPFVSTKHPELDVVIVRENEEDLYAGIEHRQTAEVTQCLKLITRPGTERICTFAFEHARRTGRRKVSVFVKDNIMKVTDGLFHQVFREVAARYPDIESERYIIDIGAARLADSPERFDVILAPNLYGDILSDIAAQIAGSVGLAGSANIGASCAMFEAVHGSAPDIAGQGIANPSGLLEGGVLMLGHLGQGDIGVRIRNAWLRTLEDGVHTGDIAGSETRHRVGTQDFADAVIANLGETPRTLAKATEGQSVPMPPPPVFRRPEKKLVGVDAFIDWTGSDRDPNVLAAALQEAGGEVPGLTMITNRGVKVWPKGLPETFKTDHWRCRFGGRGDLTPLEPSVVTDLLSRLVAAGLDVIKTENLYTFDGERGFSLGQGQ